MLPDGFVIERGGERRERNRAPDVRKRGDLQAPPLSTEELDPSSQPIGNSVTHLHSGSDPSIVYWIGF